MYSYSISQCLDGSSNLKAGCMENASMMHYVSCIHNRNSTFYELKILYPRLVASLEPRLTFGEKVSLGSRLLCSSFSDTLYVHPAPLSLPARTEVGGATVKGDHSAIFP